MILVEWFYIATWSSIAESVQVHTYVPSESAVQMVDHAGVVFFQRSSSFTPPTCMAQLEKSESEINSWRLTWYNKANCGKDHLLIKTISTIKKCYMYLFLETTCE